MKEVTKEIFKAIYKPRPLDARKYDFGLLLVIGGSEFYSGSPAFMAQSAFKAGVDMVRVIAPKRAADIIASFKPDMAAYPLKGDWLTKEHLPLLLSMTEAAKAVARGNAAVAIGGGMGRSKDTQAAIIEYLSQAQIPAVVDADAIYAVSQRPETFKGKNFLFTPHQYEFFVLTGEEVFGKSLEEKVRAVEAQAKRLGTTIVLKGKEDIISNGSETALNTLGSPYMTVGGTGDTLAGIAGALIARGVNSFLAGQAAAYLNSLAGQMAAERLGESLMASDLIEEIPGALKSVLA